MSRKAIVDYDLFDEKVRAMIGKDAAPRRLEIGNVEGDATLIGGMTHIFLEVPASTTAQELDTNDSDVVRLAKLPRGSVLHVPDNVEIVFADIVGSLLGEQLKGRLQARRVSGMVALNTVGEVTITSIAGNATVYNATGHVHIGKVAGNVLLVNVPHGVQAQVEGEVVLDTALAPHAQFKIHASANVTLRTLGEINARFVAQTERGKIRTRLPLAVEHGRKRNLVGVIGRGDAAVTLHSTHGNITIIAAESSEREQSMSKEFASDNKDQEGTRTWEGSLGGRRFRAQWERGPKRARFQFQGPFTEAEDPDGPGVPFTPDFGFEWEQGRGARAYGDYEERWEELRGKTEKAARRAAERARHYADRATKPVRDTDWEAVERDIRSAVDKALAELEETLTGIRNEWNKRRAESQASHHIQGSTAKRVPVEYDENTATADDEALADALMPTISRDERNALRRAILEELRTGTISLEEAEQRLTALG